MTEGFNSLKTFDKIILIIDSVLNRYLGDEKYGKNHRNQKRRL